MFDICFNFDDGVVSHFVIFVPFPADVGCFKAAGPSNSDWARMTGLGASFKQKTRKRDLFKGLRPFRQPLKNLRDL